MRETCAALGTREGGALLRVSEMETQRLYFAWARPLREPGLSQDAKANLCSTCHGASSCRPQLSLNDFCGWMRANSCFKQHSVTLRLWRWRLLACPINLRWFSTVSAVLGYAGIRPR